MMNLKKAIGSGLNSISVFAPGSIGKFTLELFCTPIKGRKFTSRELTFLDKAEWITVDYSGKNIQCYRWGSGPKKVLLAHGFNSNAARWRLLINCLLDAGYEVVAMDVPAHGNSDWRRVNGFLYAQTLARVMARFEPDFVVGHSFAGIAFCHYFTQMTFLPVRKMILMGVPDELQDISCVFFRELGLNDRVQQAYYKAFQQKFGYELNYFTLSNLISTIKLPGLLIHDEKDEIASFKGARKIHANWENANFLATSGLGHSLQGGIVYKAILDFLDHSDNTI